MEPNTVSRQEVKANCRYPHCAYGWRGAGGAHRFQLFSSRSEGRPLMAWYSRTRSPSDQSALPHRVLEVVSSSLQR
ncbi:hypothetical protein TNCV_820961 [Trichonephila clavipes]|nr:hypothetical protein TNCV_820961 [Trichonephila clavipes]